MTTTTSSHKKWTARVALVGAGGLAMGALAFGAAAPAQADSATLNYTCDIDNPLAPIKDAKFTAKLSVDGVPTDFKVGDSADITINSDVTAIGQAGLLRLLGVASVDGRASADSTLAGVAQPATALTIPMTNVGDGEDLATSASGKATLKATKAGKVKLAAGNFTSTINTYKADGTSANLVLAVTCTLDKGQDATIDTITVVGDETPPPTTEPPTTEPPATTPEEPTANTNVPTKVPAGMVSASNNQGSNTGELLLIGAGVAAIGAAGIGGRLMLKREKN